MPAQTPQRTPLAALERPGSGVLVDVVVLSADMPLFESIRDAIGERNPVWRARSAEEAVDLLLTGRCGVLLVDMAAVSTQPDTLIRQILDQFPDVVVCVAGRRDDEPHVVSLISDGLVYRFMHKPLSAKRAGMFLQAAIRHHVERREAGDRSLEPLRLVTGLPPRYDPLKWLFVAAGVALFVLLLSRVLDRHETTDTAAAAPPAGLVQKSAPVVQATPRADPVLSRARAAFDAGRFESPTGRNALDLFQAVLLAHPENAEAQAGLARTIDNVLAIAGHQASSGDREEAERLVKRVLAVQPGQPAAQALEARLQADAPRRTVLDDAVAPPPANAVTAAPPANAVAAAPPAPTRPSTPVPPPAPVSEPRTVAAAPSSPPAPLPAQKLRARPTVEPDPLTPHFENATTARRPSTKIPGIYRSGPHSYGPPISSGLPIAGYVNSPPPQEPADRTPTRSAATDATPTTLMPIDQFEKVQVEEPIYPPQALRDHTRGWVELEFTITATGTVRDIDVVQAEPRGVFEQAATTALGHWRFRPRVVNGQPVAQRSTVILHFDVDG